MSRYRSSDPQCKLYVGDLARDTTEKDLERAFNYYGPLKSVWVARNPAGFGFVEYDDRRDADDAVNGLDGSTINGSRVRVEHSSDRPKSRFRGGGRGGGFRDGGRDGGGFRGGRARPFNPDDRCYQCGEPGHYAYDCTNAASGSSRRGGGGGGRRSSRYSRSRSGSPRRSSYKRSYSRSRSRDRKRSRSASRSSSRSPPRKGGD